MFPKICNADANCTGTFGSQGSCDCYPNTKGYKFCKGFAGDYAINNAYLR